MLTRTRVLGARSVMRMTISSTRLRKRRAGGAAGPRGVAVVLDIESFIGSDD
jgi:hypothetical protein